MARWIVNVGDDIIVIERTDGRVVIDIPSKKPLPVERHEIEDLRLKLGAALGIESDQP